MNEIVTEIEIAAGAEKVWNVLTDFAAYQEWNSMMWPERGELRPGEKLVVRARLAGGIRISFRPTIRTAEPARELSWNGRLPVRLLQGIHSFVIQPVSQDRVRFIHRETFSGWIAPLYMLVMSAWARRAYAKMNRELKARVEEIQGRSAQTYPADSSPSHASAAS